MVKLSTFLKQQLQDRLNFYRDGKVESCIKTEPLKLMKGFQCVVVSAKHTLELKQYFAITRNKELNQAIRIFANQNSPIPNSKSWFDIKKSKNGAFVTISYISSEIYDDICECLPQGGVIIPETTLVKSMLEANAGIKIGNESLYVPDVNYGYSYIGNPEADTFLFVDSSNLVQFDKTQFVEWLRSKFHIKYLLPFLTQIHLGKKQAFSFTFKQATYLLGITIAYLGLTSGYIIYQNTITLSEFNSNKTQISALKKIESDYEKSKNELITLNKPYIEHTFRYLSLKILSDIESDFELLSLVVLNDKTSIGGYTDNATKLFKLLSEHPLVVNIQFIMPVRKTRGKEQFSIRFEIKNNV